MPVIAVLTPDPADPSYAGQWPGVLERLTESLSRGGIQTMPTPWTDHIETTDGLTGYPLILPVLSWGYHRDHARWKAATALWQTQGLPLANPASVLGWNSDKIYLRRLAERGVPIAPTIWSEGVTQTQIEAAYVAFGTDEVIVKPTVSGGAWRTQRMSPGDVLEVGPAWPGMIQPYLPTIASEGELSLLFFGGQLSHAVNKQPVDGDFRIQVQFGGQYRRVESVPDDALALAKQVLSVIEERLLYARIDMVRDADGRWLLMEAELIEPDFYLNHAPDAGAGFTAAVQAQLAKA